MAPLPRTVPQTASLIWGKPVVSHLLVIHEFPTLVNLILHREVDGGTIHVLAKKHLHFGLVCFILKIPDHIREPNCQSIVAVTKYSSSNRLYSFVIRVCIPNLM